MEIKILFYLFLNCQIIFCQKCGTDFLKIKPGIIDIVNITNKRKLNDGPRPIKIKVDMTNIKNEIFIFIFFNIKYLSKNAAY